jgi:hypothetical protein
VSVIVQRPFCVASTRCSYLPKTPISFLLAGTGPFCRLPLTVWTCDFFADPLFYILVILGGRRRDGAGRRGWVGCW